MGMLIGAGLSVPAILSFSFGLMLFMNPQPKILPAMLLIGLGIVLNLISIALLTGFFLN